LSKDFRFLTFFDRLLFDDDDNDGGGDDDDDWHSFLMSLIAAMLRRVEEFSDESLTGGIRAFVVVMGARFSGVKLC
jgi:hypothetical protein